MERKHGRERFNVAARPVLPLSQLSLASRMAAAALREFAALQGRRAEQYQRFDRCGRSSTSTSRGECMRKREREERARTGADEGGRAGR